MKTIIFTSGIKGGTGKTTITSNIALLEAYFETIIRRRGWVVALDASLDAGSLTYLMAKSFLKTNNIFGFQDLLSGLASPEDIVYEIQLSLCEGHRVILGLIPSIPRKISSIHSLTKNSSNKIMSVLLSLKKYLEELGTSLLLIDSPALSITNPLLNSLIAISDIIVLIGEPDPISTYSVYQLWRYLKSAFSIRPFFGRIILNKWSPNMELNKDLGITWKSLYYRIFKEKPFLIPYDSKFRVSRARGTVEATVIRSLHSRALTRISEYGEYLASLETLKEEYNPEKPETSSLLSRYSLKRLIRNKINR